MFLWSVCILVINLINIESARILAVFPTPSISHQYVFQPIIKRLVERGHYVVYVTTTNLLVYPKDNTPNNYKEINFQEMLFDTWHGELEKNDEGNSNNWWSQLKIGAYLVLNLFERQFNSEIIQNMLKDKEIQFDLILTESHLRIALMLSHSYQVPLIQISSVGYVYENCLSSGVPVQPLMYPELFQRKHFNLTALEKYYVMYSDIMVRLFHTFHEYDINAVIEKFYNDAPHLNLLRNNVHMLILNTYTMWDINRPAPLSVAFIYGVHQKPPEELPKDLQTYLDDSANGIIYVSFGTNVIPTQLPQDKIQIILENLSEMPYNVLLKWDKDEIPGKPKNIRIGKWFPQAHLLKHSNIKVFITQAGLQSTDEAIAAGVPLIGIPIIYDQWPNAEKYVQYGIGVKLNIETLTTEEFRQAVNTVIKDESYRKNIIKLRDIFYDQPIQPLNSTVFWIEYVLRYNGAQHLRAPGANMSWTEYFEVDLLFIALSLIISFFISTFVVVKYILFYLGHKCRFLTLNW